MCVCKILPHPLLTVSWVRGKPTALCLDGVTERFKKTIIYA